MPSNKFLYVSIVLGLIYDTAMFVRKKAMYGGKVAIQLCENHREQGKVCQRVLRHVGTADKKDEEAIQKLIAAAEFLKNEINNEKGKEVLKTAPDLPFEMPQEVPEPPPPSQLSEKKTEEISGEKELVNIYQLSEENRIVEGIHAVFGSVLDKFGLQRVLRPRQYELLRHVIMARVAWPSSKLRASRNLAKHFNVQLSVDSIYRLMDSLENAEELIQKVIFNAFRPLIGESVEVLFFDVTTLYFESTNEDELRRFGFSKDQKTHLTQVVLALATTQDGLPVGYKLFPGNTAETSTLLQAIEEWQGSLHIEKVTIVADRAMMSEKNINLLEDSGFKYVIAAKLKRLPEELRKAILSRKNEHPLSEDDQDTVTVQEHCYNGRRLIVNHSTKRACKDAHDREQILTKLRKKIGKEGSTKKLVTNRGYLAVVTEQGNSRVKVDDAKVEAAARWDGLHGVITNIEHSNCKEIISTYRRLWVIEESFRINKHTLEMRPIYHFVSRRIKAHVLMCYITFALCRYVQKRVAMQNETMSVDRIRSILIDVQYSILKNEETGCRYRLPSKMPMEARQIYGTFGLKRSKRLSKIA